MGLCCPPGSGSGLRIRILYKDPIESGSDPDPQHYLEIDLSVNFLEKKGLKFLTRLDSFFVSPPSTWQYPPDCSPGGSGYTAQTGAGA